MRAYRLAALAVLMSLAVALSAVPWTNSAQPPPYLTTGLVPSALKWTSIGGYPGIGINYTNSYNAAVVAIVFVDVTNSAGQTVLVSVGSAFFSANETVNCYVPVVGLTPGTTYTAMVFAVTTSNVPISVSSSLNITG